MIASNVNSTLKDTLASTEIDGYLFGKDLSERLKQTKLTSLDVQAVAKKSSSSAPKNSRGPLQQSRPRNTFVAAPSGHKQSTTYRTPKQTRYSTKSHGSSKSKDSGKENYSRRR
uniref:Uncharacterized protein n=1 Tax=Trichogramma kaykai TaxID=54128 RepID=A0ABD2W7N0_9HYME